MTDNQQMILNAIRESQKIQNDDFYEQIDENTVLLYFSYCNMNPTLKFSKNGVTLTSPLAYYVTGLQRDGLMVTCNSLFASNRLSIIDMPTEQSIIVTGHYSNDQSGELCSDLAFIARTKLWESISEIIFSCMPKTVTSSNDPRTLFYSALALYYNGPGVDSTYHHIDFNDIKTVCKKSERFVFYPSIESQSWDELMKDVKRATADDSCCSDIVIMSLVLPDDNEKIMEDIGHLRDDLGVSMVLRCIGLNRNNKRRYVIRLILAKRRT